MEQKSAAPGVGWARPTIKEFRDIAVGFSLKAKRNAIQADERKSPIPFRVNPMGRGIGFVPTSRDFSPKG